MRGKAAAQSANRRTSAATARLDEVTAKLAAEKAARRAEVVELQGEVRHLRADIASAASRLAADRVDAVIRDARAVAEREQKRTHDLAVESVSLLFAKLDEHDATVVAQVAQLLGVEVHEVSAAMVGDSKSRYHKRLGWGEYISNLRRLDADYAKQSKRVGTAYADRVVLGVTEEDGGDGSR